MKRIIEILENLKNFFKDTQKEVRKVTWPSRRYIVVATIIILVIVFLSGGFLMLTDFTLSKIMQYLMGVFK